MRPTVVGRLKFQGIDAGEGFGWGVVPLHELRGFFGAPTFLPADDEPFGMGIAEVRLSRFEVGEEGFGGVEFAQVAAQDGIDEAGLRAESVLPGLLDGFVDGGVVGDAVEPENLVEAETQEILQSGFLGAAGSLAGDEPIERGLPADDAVNEFLAEAAISGGKVRLSEGGGEEVFYEVIPRVPAVQNLGCNLSWFLLVQSI